MIRKISGKQYTSTVTHRSKADGSKCTEGKDIANTLADEFEKKLLLPIILHLFKYLKQMPRKTAQKFQIEQCRAILVFSLVGLENAIQRSRDTAVGPDDIHYQFLMYLPEQSLQLLLDIYNNIWETGFLSDIWREAIIISIPKPGKDTTNPTNYRPISLTSCLCPWKD